MTRGRLTLLVTLAILAFAGNSLLTRAALASGLIGAAAFAALRLLSGAVLLALLGAARRGAVLPRSTDLKGIAGLAVYMLAFTWAYRDIGAATGALILFASVQLTMIGASITSGQRPTVLEALGAALAMAGLVWLMLEDLSAPRLMPAMLMVVAGAAWGLYTLVGRGAKDPLAMTARNFIGAAPVALVAWWFAPSVPMEPMGWAYALMSGAVTSGLGYAVWYAALPGLSRITAGVAMSLVPPVTAAAAAVLLGEAITLRLVVASFAVLAGVILTIMGRRG
jgi:drug/metabolite transporter (DMT)-like permease